MPYNGLKVCDVAEPRRSPPWVRMCFHSVPSTNADGEACERSHVPAAAHSELAHALTRGPLSAKR
jgi:hypothetical protein